MSQSSSSSGGAGALPPTPSGNAAALVEVEVQEISDPAVTGTSQPDIASIIAKALSKLEPDVRAQAEDPKRKAKSKDPGWKYGFWPDPAKKDQLQCIFCGKRPHGGIIRFKMHLAGGYSVVEKCGVAPAIVRKEMNDYMRKNSKNLEVTVDLDGAQEGEGECEYAVGARGQAAAKANAPKGKKSTAGAAAKKRAQASISSYVVSGPPAKQTNTKSVASMLSKTPEEVVEERHSGSRISQPSIEQCTKTKEQKQIVDDHVADFLYENGIPLNVVNSRSWEIMIESIGQYGRGYRSPTYHELRNPLLDRAVEKTMDLRKKHEEAWQEYGCTLMSDGWTDTSHRHLINFLVNSPAGTFFLGSVDASSYVANADTLAKLLEEQIEKVGKEHVVQVITDNGALMEKIPTLFWTPCAAHCLDLMLEDIGKIKEFNSCITQAKMVTRFIYKHGRILDAMRAKIGGDLVRPAVTRFATSFLTLASMYKHKQGLKSLFVSEEWHTNKLCTSAEGVKVESIVLAKDFWINMENCMRASQPLLIALRISDGDERPALAEISAAMDTAKSTIKQSLEKKPGLLKQVLGYFDKRWENQMEQQLYGAALFLNPNRFFAIRDNNKREAARLRAMFNAVLWKVEVDDDQQSKIS
ncbi:hypothetical protein BS78_08G045300 [Paspalum vaginatum]|nr:hypothetical protein BS78_08G045300 [Paspalum vaginatum]